MKINMNQDKDNDKDKVVTGVSSPYQPYRARLIVPPSGRITQATQKALRSIATSATATTTGITGNEAISSTTDHHHITTLGHATSIRCRSALCTGFSFSQSEPPPLHDVDVKKIHDNNNTPPSSSFFDPKILQTTVRPTSHPTKPPPSYVLYSY